MLCVHNIALPSKHFKQNNQFCRQRQSRKIWQIGKALVFFAENYRIDMMLCLKNQIMGVYYK